jgi:hypothetical protein
MSKDKIDVTYAFLQIKLPRDNHSGFLMEVSAFVALRVALEPDNDDKIDTFDGLLTSFNKGLRAISKQRKLEEDARPTKHDSQESKKERTNRTLEAIDKIAVDIAEIKASVALLVNDRDRKSRKRRRSQDKGDSSSESASGGSGEDEEVVLGGAAETMK